MKQDNSKDYSIKISYLEIYNEQVRDLLVSKPHPLMIVSDPIKGVMVPDLLQQEVFNSNQVTHQR